MPRTNLLPPTPRNIPAETHGKLLNLPENM